MAGPLLLAQADPPLRADLTGRRATQLAYRFPSRLFGLISPSHHCGRLPWEGPVCATYERCLFVRHRRHSAGQSVIDGWLADEITIQDCEMLQLADLPSSADQRVIETS